ncbi:unnamed protein product [Aureobasidium pullulans]|nr:unnamed protein product [Aureobasidium pullulans]
MATAYQPTPRWEQSVPMGHEALFDPSYAFDPSQTPRDSSNYTPRRPSQHAATLDVDTYQLDQIKRDSGRSLAFTEDAATPRVPKFEEQSGEGANQDQDSDDYEERLQEEPRMDRRLAQCHRLALTKSAYDAIIDSGIEGEGDEQGRNRFCG